MSEILKIGTDLNENSLPDSSDPFYITFDELVLRQHPAADKTSQINKTQRLPDKGAQNG